jgi:hypothetical protein
MLLWELFFAFGNTFCEDESLPFLLFLMPRWVRIYLPIKPPAVTPRTVKKPCRNAPNSDVDNGGAEPKDIGIFRYPRLLVCATISHIEISRSFFLQCADLTPCCAEGFKALYHGQTSLLYYNLIFLGHGSYI